MFDNNRFKRACATLAQVFQIAEEAYGLETASAALTAFLAFVLCDVLQHKREFSCALLEWLNVTCDRQKTTKN